MGRVRTNEKQFKHQGISWIQTELKSANERSTGDSFYHHLFLSLIVTGLNNDKVRGHIGELLRYENEVLQKQIESLLGTDELHGVSTEVWSILFNALIDGLAIQSIIVDDFNVEKVYKGIESLLVKQMEHAQSSKQKD